MTNISGIAVRDPTEWLALCPEYDIATSGSTWTEAFVRLAAAIEKAVALAEEQKLPVGRPVSKDSLARFLAGHRAEGHWVRPIRRVFEIAGDRVLTVSTDWA